MIKRILGIGLCWCIPFLTVHAQQNTTLSHRFQQASLAEALSFIELHFDRQFIYDPTLINKVKIGKLTFQEATLDEVLSRLLPAAQLTYKPMDERYILIKPQTDGTPSFEESIEETVEDLPTICGQLIDFESGSPLSFASIYLKGSQRGTLTDETGNFELKGPFQQGDTIVMQYLGYAPRAIPADQLRDQPCEAQALRLQDFKIADVIVEEDAITLMEGAKDGKGAKFKPDKLDVLPGWGDNDLLRIVQLLPGVHSSDESATNIHIRGGTPDQNLILLDGIPVYHTGHFFGMFSAFNPDIVDEMEVYKGDFGARFGDRVSGVINIKSKPDNLDSTKVVAGLNLINAYTQVQAPIVPGKVAFLLAGRRSFSDLVQSATYNSLFNQLAGRGKIQDTQQDLEEEEEDVDFISSPLLNFSDINAKLQFQPFAKATGAISYYQGADRLSYGVLFDEEEFFFNSEDNIRLKNWGLSGEWRQQISSSFQVFAQAVFNEYSNAFEYRHTFERVDLDDNYDYAYFQDNTLTDLTFRLQNSWQLNATTAINFGWEYNDREVILEIRDDIGDDDLEEGGFSDEQEGKNTVFYLDFDYKLHQRLAVNLGIRSSYYSGSDQSFLEPRFSLDWKPGQENLHLKMAAGRQVQTLSQAIQNNDLGFGERIWLIADSESEIPVITGTQYSAGVWWKKNGYLIDVEWYSKRIDNLSSLNLKFDNIENPYSAGKGQMQGVDVLLRKRFNKQFDAWLAYAYGTTAYQFEGVNDLNFFPASHEQRHTITFTQLWNQGSFSFGNNLSYSSGRPFSQATEVASFQEEDEEELYYELVFGPRNAARLPRYFRWDLSGHYNFKLGKAKGRVGLSILNITNSYNVGQRRFLAVPPEDNPSNSAEVLEFDRELLGRTPNFYFKLEW